MTAEIAIFNKSAIALAADSAITIGNTGKIYNSANKLFTLSKYCPVGIMIYNNNEFMGIPWETIIKDFRKKLGKQKYNSLKEYGDKFLEYIASELNSILPTPNKTDYFTSFCFKVFQYIQDELAKRVNESIRQGKDVGPTQKDEFIHSIIHDTMKYWQEQDTKSPIDIDTVKNVFSDYGNIIEGVASRSSFSISNEENENVKNLILLIVSKAWLLQTGIVIAGFGELDTYPCFAEYVIESVFDGKLKYYLNQSKLEGSASYPGIIPFAQTEMVFRFICGIDPQFESTIFEYLTTLFGAYPDKLLTEIDQSSAIDRSDLLSKLNTISSKQVQDFKNSIEQFKKQSFIDPIVNNLGNLPKDELASMAESLVNITLFKRRISIDETETVGGPIDVAVISKGDGFIWVKRKHYFNRELNQHFFNNYFND